MIPSPNLLSMMAVFFGILFFFILALTPSIIELKKPEDPGPRIIRDYDLVCLHDLAVEKTCGENELKADISILRDVMAIIAFLPDLEPHSA